MPLYDYSCSQCGRTVEVSHGVHASGPLVCEVCGGAMRKLLSRPAIVFKGSGWAKKDAQASSHARSSKGTGQGSLPGGSAGARGSGESGGSTGAGGSGESGGSDRTDAAKSAGGQAASTGSSSGDGKAGGSGAD
ncbi:MAG TPA: FmdB family zinc ribbon protein [Candidatus Acidoferrales bacterium]|nr:FmdB family zinc ribbon protein [Candidatus Acidoferrales bacterium]